MPETMRARRGPRPSPCFVPVEEASESLQAFRRMTDGLTGRLRYPSIQSARAGSFVTWPPTPAPDAAALVESYGAAVENLTSSYEMGGPEEWRANRNEVERTRTALLAAFAQQAGAVRSPHSMVDQLLLAGHRAGLPQAWAEMFAAWLRVRIDLRWGREQLPLRESRRRALQAESRANVAELSVLQEGETLAGLMQEANTLGEEVAADLAHLAYLRARIRALEAAAVSGADGGARTWPGHSRAASSPMQSPAGGDANSSGAA